MSKMIPTINPFLIILQDMITPDFENPLNFVPLPLLCCNVMCTYPTTLYVGTESSSQFNKHLLSVCHLEN